jgi:hypothetical protein
MKALLSALGLVALTLMLSGTAAAQCRITAQADSNTTLPAATIGKPYSAYGGGARAALHAGRG